MNYCQRLGKMRREPAPPPDELIEGETARFDGELWNAAPQDIKNRYPRARGNWFEQRPSGQVVFAVSMSAEDGRRFLADVLAWLRATGMIQGDEHDDG